MTEPLQRSSTLGYRPDIDGLRAVAVLSVVAFHAFPSWVQGGFVGVDVFFVISGFLISRIIFEKLNDGGFSFGWFYARRIRRIFPALLVVLISTYAFGWFALFANEYVLLGKHVAAGAGFASNFVLWSESGYFDAAGSTKPLLNLWSLGVEEQFYIIWPFIVWLAWKAGIGFLSVTILAAVVSFGLNIRGMGLDPVATFYSPLTRFWEILSGSILAWMSVRRGGFHAHVRARVEYCFDMVLPPGGRWTGSEVLSNVMSLAGCLLLGYGFFGISRVFSYPGGWALVPVVGAMLVIASGPGALINKKVLSSRLFVWFGLISFPLYLWHWPLLSLAAIVEDEPLAREIRLAIVILSIALAWLTYCIVERPMRSAKNGTIKVFVLVLLMSCLGAYSLASYLSGYTSPAAQRTAQQASQLGFALPVGTDDQMARCRHMFPDRLEMSSKIRDDNFCYIQKAGEPNVIMIGDSMNPSVFSGFSDIDGLNILVLSASAAAPFYDLRSTNVGDRIRWNNYLMTNQALNYAIANENIKVVVLSALSLPFVTNQDYKFRMWDVTRPDYDDVHDIFVDAMSRTVLKLLSANKKVVYVMPNPALDYEPSACLHNLRPFTLTKESRACFRTRESVDVEYRTYREWVAEVLYKFPKVVVFDMAPIFCNDMKCFGALEGSILYRDRLHLSVDGAKLVAPHLQRLMAGLL